MAATSTARLTRGQEARTQSAPRAGTRALRPKISWLFSFEFVFLLTLFPGFREGFTLSSPWTWVVIVSFLSGVWIILTEGRFVPRRSATVTLAGLVFIAFCLLSVTYSPSQVWGPQKAFVVGTLNSWSLIAAAFIIAPNRNRLLRFEVLLVCVSLGIAGVSLLAYARAGSVGFITTLGAEYLTLSRLAGYGVVLVLVYSVLLARRMRHFILAIGCLVILLFTMLVSGGRGPLVAALMISPVVLFARVPFQRGTSRPATKRFFLVGGVILLLVVPLLVGRSALTLERLGVLLDSPTSGASGNVRLTYFHDAVEIWKGHPFFGAGLGSWPVLSGLGDTRSYPHNLVLEVAAETGTFGLLLLLLFLGYAFRSVGPWGTIRTDPLRLSVIVLFGYRFFGSLVSGDLSDARGLFALAGLCVAALPIKRDAARLPAGSSGSSRRTPLSGIADARRDQ